MTTIKAILLVFAPWIIAFAIIWIVQGVNNYRYLILLRKTAKRLDDTTVKSIHNYCDQAFEKWLETAVLLKKNDHIYTPIIRPVGETLQTILKGYKARSDLHMIISGRIESNDELSKMLIDSAKKSPYARR